MASLTALPHKPTVRVVFDPGTPAADYVQPVQRLHAVAHVMGELLDSYDFPAHRSTLLTRTQSLLSQLGTWVDVWEIANEINGEWLRPHPNGSTTQAQSEEAAIGALIGEVYDLVHAVGAAIAVTLYYNDDGSQNGNCYQLPLDSWRTWPQAYLPDRVREGANYALFSYYGYQDCVEPQPQWAADFILLGQQFPAARLGFGEIGTSELSAPRSVQEGLLTTYYGMIGNFANARFIGGVFWWNYAEQMVPHTTGTYWPLLRDTIAPLPAPQ